jgi:hypothetical protein
LFQLASIFSSVGRAKNFCIVAKVSSKAQFVRASSWSEW